MKNVRAWVMVSALVALPVACGDSETPGSGHPLPQRDNDTFVKLGSEVQMSTHGVEVLDVPGGGAAVVRQLAFDGKSASRIQVESASATLDVRLRTPAGRVVSFKDEGSVGPYMLMPTFTQYVLEDAFDGPGAYTLEVAETGANATQALLTVDEPNSRLQLGIGLAGPETIRPVGQPFAVFAVLEDDHKADTNPGKLELRLRNGAHDVVSKPELRDDGKDGDMAAGDGVFTALVTLPEPGTFALELDVARREGDAVRRRTATKVVDGDVLRASIAPGTTDRLVDQDGDGAPDALIVSPAIDVVTPGIFDVAVTLSKGGRETTAMTTLDARPNPPGRASPEIAFDAAKLQRELGDEGPYVVESVSLLLGDTDVGRHLLDFRTPNAELATRDLRAATPTTRIPPNAEAVITYVDVDGDGIDDAFDMAVPISTSRRGKYLISAEAADVGGDGEVDIGPDTQKITIHFAGYTADQIPLKLSWVRLYRESEPGDAFDLDVGNLAVSIAAPRRTK